MAAPDARIPVVLNARAGLDPTDAAELERRLGAEHVRVLVRAPADIETEVRVAREAGADIIGIAGGDGSMRTAASVLAGSPTALACIPTGTLNHFARRVGIHDIADAADALRARRVETLAVGTVQDAVFLNTLTFGEYPRIVRIRERLRGRFGKWFAAGIAFGIALLTLRRMTVRLHVDDEVILRTTPFVWVGMGWGSFPRVHEALERRKEPDLEVTVLRSRGALRSMLFLLRLGFRMAAGQQPVRDRALDVLHTRSLTLDLPHRLDATADGEVLRLTPPVEVRIGPRLLRVIGGPRLDTAGDA